MSSASSSNNSTSNAWEWVDCSYELKKDFHDDEVYWNFEPSIILTNPLRENAPQPDVKIKIEMERSFLYDDSLKWHWHKSWNLPNVTVSLEVRDNETNEILLAPSNLHARIFAVKLGKFIATKPINLIDVGLKGSSQQKLFNGYTIFSGIKFVSTSYNHEGANFHLALTIFSLTEDHQPKILVSKLSPPIFVDSRKLARDSLSIKNKKLLTMINPFHPEILDVLHFKRSNKRKQIIEEEISNDFQGLFNYYTAPNIRNKVRHPVFLSIKFSQCMGLFYNQTLIKDKNCKEQKLVLLLHNEMFREYGEYLNSSNLNLPRSEYNSENLKKTLFLLVLVQQPPNEELFRKISDNLDFVSSNVLRFVNDIKDVPTCFKPVENLNALKSISKKLYLKFGKEDLEKSLKISKYQFSNMGSGIKPDSAKQADIRPSAVIEQQPQNNQQANSKLECSADSNSGSNQNKKQTQAEAVSLAPKSDTNFIAHGNPNSNITNTSININTCPRQTDHALPQTQISPPSQINTPLQQYPQSFTPVSHNFDQMGQMGQPQPYFNYNMMPPEQYMAYYPKMMDPSMMMFQPQINPQAMKAAPNYMMYGGYGSQLGIVAGVEGMANMKGAGYGEEGNGHDEDYVNLGDKNITPNAKATTIISSKNVNEAEYENSLPKERSNESVSSSTSKNNIASEGSQNVARIQSEEKAYPQTMTAAIKKEYEQDSQQSMQKNMPIIPKAQQPLLGSINDKYYMKNAYQNAQALMQNSYNQFMGMNPVPFNQMRPAQGYMGMPNANMPYMGMHSPVSSSANSAIYQPQMSSLGLQNPFIPGNGTSFMGMPTSSGMMTPLSPAGQRHFGNPSSLQGMNTPASMVLNPNYYNMYATGGTQPSYQKLPQNYGQSGRSEESVNESGREAKRFKPGQVYPHMGNLDVSDKRNVDA